MTKRRTSPPWKHRSEVIEMPDDRLRLVVVADTHSRPHPSSHEHIEALKPDTLLHAGDIGNLAVIDRLSTIAPVLAVRGNIDARGALVDGIDVVVQRGADVILRLYLLHIAVYGPKLRADAARRAQRHQAQMVVCGHSHVPFIGRDRGMLVFNPGSIGPRRFHLPITFGVIDITPNGVDVRHVSAETGQPWSP